ncbi:hypothetical protein LTR17_020232 [Elasticomyces elasticus]|nr:hypothetical protein LTR17_020232 [Elasticomyces elasticus]
MAPAQRGYAQRSSKQKPARRPRQGKEVANAASIDNGSMTNEEIHEAIEKELIDTVNSVNNKYNIGDEIDYNTHINDAPKAAIKDGLESTATEQSNAIKDGPENLPVGNWGSPYYDDLLTPTGSVEDEPKAVVDQGKKASVEDEPEPLFSSSRKTTEVKDTSRLENCIAGSCDLCRATAPHESELPPSHRGQRPAQPGQTDLPNGGRRYDHLLWGGDNGLEGKIPRTIYGVRSSMSGPSGLGYPSSFAQDNPMDQSIRDPVGPRTIRASSRDRAAFNAALQVPGSEAFQLDSRFQAEFERECRRASRMHDAKVRELGGPSAGGIYQSGFGRHDSGDGVSEVSSAEMQQAERVALERKLMAKEGELGSVSSIDEVGSDYIRRDQKIKKEQRKARERERNANEIDSQTRSFYGTDVPTLHAEIERLRRRAKHEYGAGSRYENEIYLRDDDTHDTVSEVSFVEIDEAEDKAWREKMLGRYTCGPPRPMSPFNEGAFANIRRDQKAKKEERRTREKERRKSHSMPSGPTAFPTPTYAQDIYGNFQPINRTGRLGADDPYGFIMGGHDMDDYNIHHGIGSYPSRMPSGTRHFNNDGISSALRDLYSRIRGITSLYHTHYQWLCVANSWNLIAADSPALLNCQDPISRRRPPAQTESSKATQPFTMTRRMVTQSWAASISAEYDSSHNYDRNTGDQSTIPDGFDDERSNWERETRFGELDNEYQSMRALRQEIDDDESNELQTTRRGRPHDHWRDLEPTPSLPAPVEHSGLPHHNITNQQHNSRRPNLFTHGDDRGARDVLLAPYVAEPKHSYLSRMNMDGESLPDAENRWHDYEGRWRPFVAESKKDYLQRIETCSIVDKPTASESKARWQALEGRFEPILGEQYRDYLDRLDRVATGSERPRTQDCQTRWLTLEGKLQPYISEEKEEYVQRMRVEHSDTMASQEAEDRWSAAQRV